jgi:16S rRNA (guanine527-N7)-methyltransferase
MTSLEFQIATRTLPGFPGDVSRETLRRLEIYADLLAQWNKTINLVAAATLPDMWRRHFLDSAQLLPLACRNGAPKSVKIWVDLGSGAGFPGLVLAILSKDFDSPPMMHLIESDARKCAFLREAARLTETNVILHNSRIETVETFPADVVTARALAPLAKLLDLSARFIGPDTTCLFLKGEHIDEELTEATKCRKMDIERFPSRSDPKGIILRLKGPSPKSGGLRLEGMQSAKN